MRMVPDRRERECDFLCSQYIQIDCARLDVGATASAIDDLSDFRRERSRSSVSLAFSSREGRYGH